MPKESIDEWLDDIDEESIQASLDAGEILPNLKSEVGKVYHVTVMSTPVYFTSDFGKTPKISVDYEGLLHSLIMPKSFRFQLAVAMIRKGYVDSQDKPDFAQIVGKHLTFTKIIGDTKQYKKAKLYTVQIDD